MKQAYIYSRWSDAKQSKGDSLERQMEIGLDWYNREIKHLGILLCPLKCDDGFSAYKGEHVKRGSLGHFLAEIKAGNISAGSILITENLDRISRQGPKIARKIIEQVVDKGVEMHICNINVKLTYGWEDDHTRHIIVDCELGRAYRESKFKSDRIGGAWRRLKANACNKNHKDYGLAINSTGSPWEYVRKGERITISEQDQATILFIFEQAALHQGCRKIAWKLNQHPELYPMFNPYERDPAPSNPYTMSLVYAVLTARSLIGEHQFLKEENGQLTEDGEPVTGGVYKPITVLQTLWKEANDAMIRRKLKNKEFRPKTKKEKRNGLRNKVNRLPANSSNIFSSIIWDDTPVKLGDGLGPKSMYFHQRNTGERAKTFIGTYLVTNFSYEGAIANRMRYDHFEKCFFKVVRTLKKLDWKNIFACVRPKEIITVEDELNEALREDDSLANTTIPKLQRAIENPKSSEDAVVEFTNQIMAARRRCQELKPKIETLQAALKSEEDKFQPYHNIDEQIEMLQNDPQAEDLRLRAKADIMKIVTRIGLVFGFDPDKGKEITATINFTDGLVRTVKFYPQEYYAEMDHGKGKSEIVRFDHGHHPPYKLTEADAREVYRLYDHGNGICQKEIAPMMGVTRGIIYNILIGKQYPHLYKELNGSPPINIGNRGKHKLGEKEAREIWEMHLEGDDST